MRLHRERAGCSVELGPPLSSGGEGTTHPVVSDPTLLAKVLTPRAATPEKANKVGVLLRWPVRDTRLAFPVDRLLTGPGQGGPPGLQLGDHLLQRAPVGGRPGHPDRGVGQANYLPAEFQGKDLRTTDRTAEADAFATHLLAWEVLKDAHAFAAAGPGPMPPVRERVRAGVWPWDHTRTLPPGWLPVDAGIPFAEFPAGVRDCFRRALVDGHRNPAARPTPAELRDELAHWLPAVGPWPGVPGRWAATPAWVGRAAWAAARARWHHPLVRRHRGAVAAGVAFAALAGLKGFDPPGAGRADPPGRRERLRADPAAIPDAPALWRAALAEGRDGAQRE